MSKNLPNRSCPLESMVERTLRDCGVAWTVPERTPGAGTYDFYVPGWDVHIEVKAFDTPRTERQIDLNGERPVIVLVGEKAVQLFCKMLYASK